MAISFLGTDFALSGMMSSSLSFLCKMQEPLRKCKSDAMSATDAGGAVNLLQWMLPGYAKNHGNNA